jgi:hypothetical protein
LNPKADSGGETAVQKRPGWPKSSPKLLVTAASAASKDEAVQVSFGIGRAAGRSARRLFIQQKHLMSPVFAAQPERPRAILRVISGS